MVFLLIFILLVSLESLRARCRHTRASSRSFFFRTPVTYVVYRACILVRTTVIQRPWNAVVVVPSRLQRALQCVYVSSRWKGRRPAHIPKGRKNGANKGDRIDGVLFTKKKTIVTRPNRNRRVRSKVVEQHNFYAAVRLKCVRIVFQWLRHSHEIVSFPVKLISSFQS